MDQYLSKAMDFLNSIGITTRVVVGSTGFTPHCEILNGSIHVDPRCRASELLHEAGHLATVPGQYRHLLSGNITKGQAEIFRDISSSEVEPDSPLSKAVVQMSDGEATAWAWACGKKAGIPEDLIIQDDEYNGQGDFLRGQLTTNTFEGIEGLAFAGFCRVKARHPGNLPVYPELEYWTHPVLDAKNECWHG